MQAKLLRVLQDGRVVRIGGYRPVQVDVQIIAAANQDLMQEVENGGFREDLYYRLNVIHIKLPPLRDRKEDIPFLVRCFIETNHAESPVRDVGEEVLRIFLAYDWPGNVRQLYNILERMIILADGRALTRDLIPDEIARNAENSVYAAFDTKKIDTLALASAKYVNNVLLELNGNVKRTAENLRVSRATVYRILKNAGYDMPPDRGRKNAGGAKSNG
jgi:transcriptional regulator with PAS, ATPase and Fis domain